MLFTKPITHEESVPLHSSNTQQQYETPFSTYQKLAQSPVFQDGCHRAFPLHSMLYHLFCPNGTPHQRSHQKHPILGAEGVKRVKSYFKRKKKESI